ncbi:hypothetical protein CHS0354_027843 [Potamilus streckersoni]|uniref:PX domain-containing protein n=1 Tax=Potamilus streckersoni TaxID=2493646 RepID=A0AAE0T0Q5_9BIVA|nr:hypothetical protein CHS0354_027843 [Potamilus streckersoni]
MAQFGKDLENFNAHQIVKIVGSETNENYTVYILMVHVSPYTWTVRHRYSDFHELHEKLMSICKLDKNLLPGKKLFGNQNESFIKKRQNDLEVYIQTILYSFAQKLPHPLASFLHFEKYEIHGITQSMAEELYHRGDILLQNREVYTVTPLQLYSLTERLKLPEPTCESGDVKKDIGHILDFITRLKNLKVCSGEPVGTSDIDMNKLKFDLTLFKSLQSLTLVKCNWRFIEGLETVKQTLSTINVHYTVGATRDIVLQDVPHWREEDGTLVVSYWEHIKHADFSNNSIKAIDDSVQLMPRIEQLNLSHNQIDCIQHLQWLSEMTSLDLSYNLITSQEALHTKLGNLKILNLARNKLETLQGFSKLFSLETLDVSHNKISQVEEVQSVCSLPCLENFLLIGNPVTIVLDYRTRTLAMFGDRVNEVTLDKEKASQKELDTVAVLQAIQKSKDRSSKKVARDAQMSESYVSEGSSISIISATSQSTSGNQVKERSSIVPLVHRYKLYTKTSGYSSSFVRDLNSGSSNKAQWIVPEDEIKRTMELKLSEEDEGRIFIMDQSNTLSMDTSQVNLSSSQNIIDSTSSQNMEPDGVENNYYPVPLHSEEPILKVKKLNISSLPGIVHLEFTSWLHKHLFGEESDDMYLQEKLVNIMWCNIVQYSKPETFLPVCAVMTERRIFILLLSGKDSGFPEVPDMETFYILPLSNIQQVLVGVCYSYIRLEEAFVGSFGTFALLMPDSDSGKAFYDDLCSLFGKEKDSGELDVINCSQSSDLTQQIFDMEEEHGLCTGRIAFACHGRNPGSSTSSYLLLSENYIYIMKENCLFWPKPTFEVSAFEKSENFETLKQYSVEAKISEMTMYSSVSKAHAENQNSLKSNNLAQAFSPSGNKVPGVEFSYFGLSAMFHELLGTHKFDYFFPSTKARNMFWDRLTNLRAEHAHRMSPSTREEPEGGNESSDSLDLQNQNQNQLEQDGPDNTTLDECTDSWEKEDIVGELGSSIPRRETLEYGKISVEGERKMRSKTEIVLPVTLHSPDGEQHLPSYTWSYLTPELSKYLKSCLDSYNLVHSLSAKLGAIMALNGETLVQHFHQCFVPVGVEGEELHHVLWSNVVPYTNPNTEIVTLIMLSNRAVYLVSDACLQRSHSLGRPSWKTHARHVSDSMIGFQSRTADKHHSAGILCSSEGNGSIVKPYKILEFSEICQVNIGLFDQCIRLTGDSGESVFTIVTRDPVSTSTFMKNLSAMLSLSMSSPMLDKSSCDLEQDFYKAFHKRTKTTIEGMEYIHPSKVKFCYPGDEAVSDLLFIINEHLKLMSLRAGKDHILTYVLGYLSHGGGPGCALIPPEPQSIILTNDCVCFVAEDVVSYPLPDFVRGLPLRPRQKVTEIRKIEYVKRLQFTTKNSREITLVFSDEKEDLVLVQDHYSLKKKTEGRKSPPEVTVKCLIESEKEFNKFVQLFKAQWKEKHNGNEVPIQVE